MLGRRLSLIDRIISDFKKDELDVRLFFSEYFTNRNFAFTKMELTE